MVRVSLAGGALLVASACAFDPQLSLDPFEDTGVVINQDGGAGPVDAAPAPDSGTPDAGTNPDTDAEPNADASLNPDAGEPDAGFECGNAVIAAQEECDDGNRSPEDGCSSTCTVEPGWTCEGVPSICTEIPVELSIVGSSAAEGDILTFTLTQSRPTDEDVTFEWTTVDGTAEAGSDYNAGGGSSSIPSGQTEVTLTIPTILDTELEPIETMEVVLTAATGADIRLGTATGTIAGPPLINNALVVRYFLDEQATGEPVGPILDAAPTPFNLTLTRSDIGPEYLTATNLNRGLFWSATGNSGWVSAPVDGSKIEDRLDGARQLTLEVLVNAQDAPDFSRLIHIGGTSDRGAISLNLSNTTIEVLRTGEDNIVWSDNTLQNRGLLFITVTFDSLSPPATGRIELYYNGESSGVNSPVAPPFGEQIAIEDDDDLYIGNRGDGDRSLSGWIGYVAIYDNVLSPNAVRQNAHRILARDDSGLP